MSEKLDLEQSPTVEPAAEILDERIWVDGCWDFFHHGHAGAILQARKLGTELYVGVHSDESILENKGPTVMTLEERIIAVNSCKWVTRSISHAPYVTSLPWITHYGCKYVVHGDDITSDSDGQDCYRFVKAAGRFKVVKRTPSISTTDLVGRMLLCTRTHFIKDLYQLIQDEEGDKPLNEGVNVKKLIQAYATDETGLNPSSSVWHWESIAETKGDYPEKNGNFTELTQIIVPKPGQRVVYVDGSFDLFSSGHIEFLRLVIQNEENIGRKIGWFNEPAVRKRIISTGGDYAPAYIIAGIHNDEAINRLKGLNYPIMNIVERGLCVLQCKYINSVIFGAPTTITRAYLNSIPCGTPCAVYHGTKKSDSKIDQYLIPKEMGIYHEIKHHVYSGINASKICQRILESRHMYEERQRLKALKSIDEQKSP